MEQAATVSLATDGRHGQGETATVMATITLPAGAKDGEFALRWVVRDFRRGVIASKDEQLPAAGTEPLKRPLPVVLADSDPRAWVCWVQAAVAKGGVKLAEAEQAVYRWRPFNMREQIVFGSWHTEIGARPTALRPQVVDYLREIGLRSASRDTGEVLERAGFRTTMEHDAMTVVGASVASFDVTPENREQAWQAEGRGRGRQYKSPAVTVFSMGEETGYCGNWSQAYPWRDKEEAPERATFWFREYLKLRYKTVEALNARWGVAFKDWAEVKYLRKYAYPYGWLYVKPAADVEQNLAPYVDTHAFAEWWVNEYVRNFTAGLRQEYPVGGWSKSFEFTFTDWCEIPMTHFCSTADPHGTAMWHAYARRKTPGDVPFYHLNWGFYEDTGQTMQFWLQGIIAGATYLDNWGELFNWDMTHTRASLAVKELARQLEPSGNLMLNAHPVDDPRIGIFLEETPWRLARGRPAYFLKGRGPNAETYGALVESPPCASYLASAEGPLFAALTSTGYAPRYIAPAEIAGCRIIFLPYAEAMSQENAGRLREFVGNGGILVALPKLAEYDEGGKPYAEVPGAGLAELFGLRVQGDWMGRESIVPLPGHDDSARILYEYYQPGQKLPPEKEAEVLAFNFPASYGGHPIRLTSEAHQSVKPVDAKVLARHEDNEPAITWRKYGKGAAIFLNVLHGWPGLLHVPTDLRAVAFAYTLRTIVEYAGIQADCWFETMSDNGSIAPQLAVYRYTGPKGIIRVIGVYNDWRSADVETRFIINTPVKAVYDVLTGERLPLRTHLGRQCAYVPVPRGNGKLLALLPYEVTGVKVEAAKSSVKAGEMIELTASIVGGGENADVHPGRVMVLGADGRLLDGGRNILLDGKPVRIPTYLDQPGARWEVAVRDCTTRKVGACTVNVRPDPVPVRLPAEKPFGWPSWRKLGIDVGPAEFEQLLDDLAAIYLEEDLHPTFAYSFYVQETSRGRHRIGQLLSNANWLDRLGVIQRMMDRGKRIVLLGEDMGLDPKTSDPAVPLTEPTQLAALEELARKAKVFKVTGLPDVLAMQVGKGWIILDRRSPDRDCGPGPTRMNAWLERWRQGMRIAGLLPGGTPGNTGIVQTEDKPHIDLRAWLRRKL